MRILVDCAFVSANSVITGIPRVVFKYLEHGQAYARKHGVTVLPVYVRPEGVFDARYALPDWVRRGFGEVPLAEAEAADALHRRHAYLRRVVAPATRTLAVSLRAVGLDRLIEHARAAYHRRNQARMLSIGSGRPIPIEPGDVLFMPALWHDEAPESYRHAKDAGARIVPLLHDVLPITTPEHYDAKWRQTFARSVVAVAGLADHLMYVSEATQADFVPVLTRAGTDEPPHSVHHHGADFAMPGEAHAVSADVKAFLRGSEPRVLVVGTIEPKKNHAAAIAASQSLWASGVSFRLCIIGRPSWRSEPIVAAIQAAAAHPLSGRNIAWFRDASDADLAFAYANSELCLLPSLAEGFGLPLIEALTRKLPVLASGIPVFREIAGDHAAYFDLAAPSGLADGLAGLISEPKRLEAARRRAAAFRWPDWAAQCERTFDMLCGIAKGRGT